MNRAAANRRAPYKPGDRVRVLHQCSNHGTASGAFTIQRVVALATNNTWRIEMNRCDSTPMHATVNQHGRDRHGYVEPIGGTQ